MNMKKLLCGMITGAIGITTGFASAQDAETVEVVVQIENIAPTNGVAITPVWVGFHNGNFDSYNGGLKSLKGLERVAEDGNTAVLSRQFLDFNAQRGGYTYVDISRKSPRSGLVRTGDLTDANRRDATLGAAPLLPGQSASQTFTLKNDGSNNYLSYVSMVLPTNDFFMANGNPLAHSISGVLNNGGELSFLIGTPNGGVNDAATERENFDSSAGNGLFPGRNLPAGQSGPNIGTPTSDRISNVVGNPFANFRLRTNANQRRIKAKRAIVNRIIRILAPHYKFPGVRTIIARLKHGLAQFEASLTIDVDGLDFNQYEGGIARVTVTVANSSD